ncbi:hypothetical protein ELG97_37115 [Rhizobium leguminosarum]|uniref:hypothetical protein n=1 Tax=Rhizobium leguminosarum TaxID=384 RepID=UPI0010301C9D|nr:hypothetical protein [Rhizobium leguminosarum]TBE73852.1 hypothetical protein ELG97_37115 [Rhizobium leguminosarum]
MTAAVKLGFYDLPQTEAQLAGVEPKVAPSLGPSAWLSGDADQRRQDQDAEQRRIYKLKIAKGEVSELADHQAQLAGRADFDAIKAALPPIIGSQFKPQGFQPIMLNADLPHLRAIRFGSFPIMNKDGTEDVCTVERANFTPLAIDTSEGRMHYTIPDQRGKTSRDNKPSYAVVRHKLNPDGSLGEVRKDLGKGGVVMQTGNLRDVAKGAYNAIHQTLTVRQEKKRKQQKQAHAQRMTLAATAVLGMTSDSPSFNIPAIQNDQHQPARGMAFGR